MTLASSWRFLASVFCASVSAGLLGASKMRQRSALMRPLRAFHLDPIPARSARVARCQTLGHDTLEPELAAVIEQDLAVWKRLDLLEKWAARLAAKPIEIPLALGQRQASQIHAI
jgi:hypothetical protein